MHIQTHADQSAAVLAMTSTVAKIGHVMSRADEYILANRHTLKTDRQKFIDIGVLSLMQFECPLFNWTVLRQIFIERLGVFEHGSLPWYIDIDRSTDRVLTIRHDNGTQLQFELGQLLLAALISTH